MKLGHQSKGIGGLVIIDSYSHTSVMIFDPLDTDGQGLPGNDLIVQTMHCVSGVYLQ